MPQPTARPKPTSLAVVAAARQPVVPFQDVDAPLGPGPEPEAAPEPPLPLVLLAGHGSPARLGQDDAPDTPLTIAVLVLRRVQAPVPGHQVRRVPEARLVGVEAGDEVRVLQPDVVQDGEVADDACRV